jgi:hypothetical protein
MVHARHAKYRLASRPTDAYIVPMTKSTIRGLFELLMGSDARAESDMAQALGVDFVVLRARWVDLKAREILRGPYEDGPTTTWKSWFPSVLARIEASERSGLRASSPVLLRRTWWRAMWANE